MLSLLKELWKFARTYNKKWMFPIMLILLAIGGLVVFVQGSAIAPLIYALF